MVDSISENEQHGRLRELLDIHIIHALSVIILGLGRTGMAMLRKFIEFPIARITGVDHDSVSEREEGSVFPLGSAGKPKVQAAAEFCEYWTPDVQYVGVKMKIELATLSHLLHLIDLHDVLIWAADDWEMLQEVSQVTHSRIPMVGAAMSESGALGEVAWSAPGQTKPLSETLQADQKKTANSASSLPLDVDAVANVAVSVALGLALAGKKGFELFQDLLDPAHPLLIVHNRANNFTHSSNELVPRLVRLIPNGRR